MLECRRNRLSVRNRTRLNMLMVLKARHVRRVILSLLLNIRLNRLLILRVIIVILIPTRRNRLVCALFTFRVKVWWIRVPLLMLLISKVRRFECPVMTCRRRLRCLITFLVNKYYLFLLICRSTIMLCLVLIVCRLPIPKNRCRILVSVRKLVPALTVLMVLRVRLSVALGRLLLCVLLLNAGRCGSCRLVECRVKIGLIVCRNLVFVILLFRLSMFVFRRRYRV